MKYLRITWIVAIILLAISSCTKTAEVDPDKKPQPPIGETELRFTGSVAQTRTQFIPDQASGSVKVQWLTSDKIGISSAKGENAAYQAAENNLSTIFTAVTTELKRETEAATYYAYYPHGTATGLSVPMPNISAQTYEAEKPSKYDFLYASATATTGGEVGFHFQHLFAFVRLDISNDCFPIGEEAPVLKTITIKNLDGKSALHYNADAQFDLATGKITAPSDFKSSYAQMTVALNNLVLRDGEIRSIYIPILSQTEGSSLSFDMSYQYKTYDDSGNKLITVSGVDRIATKTIPKDGLLAGSIYVVDCKKELEKTVTILNKATKGSGIDLIIMGDAFDDTNVSNGTYDRMMRKAMDAFFGEEPYASFKDLFNVYSVEAISEDNGYKKNGNTIFSGFFGQGTEVGGNDSKCISYAMRIPGMTYERLGNALIIVMMNREYYAGTCYMYYPDQTAGDYGSGLSIAFFPLGTDTEMFNQLLMHEAGGHGFPKLDDEYFYSENGRIPADVIADNRQLESYGWLKNVDFTSDKTKVKWSHFITDTRYKSEKIGVFEGASTYLRGAYRPTDDSIMNENLGGFNAPSREAIYYRIHKLAYGATWSYNYETFATYDAVNRTKMAARNAYTPVRSDLKPLHRPVIRPMPWR